MQASESNIASLENACNKFNYYIAGIINIYGEIKKSLDTINKDYEDSKDTSIIPYVIENNNKIIIEIDKIMSSVNTEKEKVIGELNARILQMKLELEDTSLIKKEV